MIELPIAKTRNTIRNRKKNIKLNIVLLKYIITVEV